MYLTGKERGSVPASCRLSRHIVQMAISNLKKEGS